MEISLTPELDQFVKRQIDSGNYSSAADVVLTAINFFKEHEHVKADFWTSLEKFREEHDIVNADINPDEIFANVRDRSPGRELSFE
jgi:putative addiction module CopG family antidote